MRAQPGRGRTAPRRINDTTRVQRGAVRLQHRAAANGLQTLHRRGGTLPDRQRGSRSPRKLRISV